MTAMLMVFTDDISSFATFRQHFSILNKGISM